MGIIMYCIMGVAFQMELQRSRVKSLRMEEGETRTEVKGLI